MTLKENFYITILTSCPPIGIFLVPLKAVVHVDYSEPPGVNKPKR
jgi:hypothetical protein